MTGVFVMVFIMFFILVIAVAINGGRRSKQEKQWQQTARDLGLSFSPGPQSGRPIHSSHLMPQLYGQHDGQDVYVGVRTYTTGSGSDQQTHYYTFVDVVFEPALKRGLCAVGAGGVSKFFGTLFGQRDIQVGDEAFDRDFRIDGFEPAQISQLLGQPRLIALLSRSIGEFKPDLNDGRVRFEAGGVLVESAALKPVLGPAVQLFREVLQSWLELPPSAEERAVESAWTSAAGEHELTYQSRGMRMIGRNGPVTLRAEVMIGDGTPWVRDAGWRTTITAFFDPPLGAGLALSREGITAKLGKLFGSQDVQLDDDAFDKEFIVKANDPAQVKTILSADARASLLVLGSRGSSLEVDDTQVKIVLAEIVSGRNELTTLIQHVRDAATAMVAHRQPKAHGPYR